MADSEWVPKAINYDDDTSHVSIHRQHAHINPLSVESITTVGAFSNPLHSKHNFSQDNHDPLSSLLNNISSEEALVNTSNKNKIVDDTSLWSRWRRKLLIDYEVGGNVIIFANEFSDNIGLTEENSRVKTDRYSRRLANLEKNDSSEEKMEITQYEYHTQIQKIAANLRKAWANDERVQSLRLAIQLAKLLANPTHPKFYPTSFIHVSEALDSFGTMVYDRLHQKAEEGLHDKTSRQKTTTTKLGDTFNYTEIPVIARETCQNWIDKISCIRELVPRIYTEIALLKCYRFIMSIDYYPKMVQRIGGMIRGIGNTMVSNYMRVYLIAVWKDLLVLCPSLSHSLPEGQADVTVFGLAEDMFYTLHVTKQPAFVTDLQRQGVQLSDYFQLLSPAIHWILQSSAKNTNAEQFRRIIVSYHDLCDNNANCLSAILSSFDASLYAHAVNGIVALIKGARYDTTTISPTAITPADLYSKLGDQLCIYPPTTEEQKVKILNEIWKLLQKIDNITSYVHAALSWLNLIVIHYSEREATVMMHEITNKISCYLDDGKSLPDNVLLQLETFIINIIKQSIPKITKDRKKSQEHHELIDRLDGLVGGGSSNSNSSSSNGNSSSSSRYGDSEWIVKRQSKDNLLLGSGNFLPLLEAFSVSKKVDICQRILECFNSSPSSNDAILLYAILDLAKILHDSVDALSPVVEVKEVTKHLRQFISHIDFGRDLEQQLALYVDCRAMFTRLDDVMESLVMAVAGLALKTHGIVKGRHTKKTSSFVKACMAYCHITIPSIQSPFMKLKLLSHCAEISLLNRCLPQTDTFLKASISLLPDLAPYLESEHPMKLHSEGKVGSAVKSLLSLLVVVPGHPSIGPFYILKGLLSALPRFPWQPHTGLKISVYIDIIVLLCTLAQSKLPYHLPHVQSNDELFGGTIEYHHELRVLLSGTIQDTMKQLTELNLLVGKDFDKISIGDASNARRLTASTSSSSSSQPLVRLALDLVCILIDRMTVNEMLIGVISNLLALATRNLQSASDKDYFKSSIRFIQIKSTGNYTTAGLITRTIAKYNEEII